MIAWRCIFTAIIGALLAGCGPSHSDRERLERAEAIVRQYPDSSLSILDSITSKSLQNKQFGARAAIVEAEAAYKMQRPLPSDSAFATMITVLSQHKLDSYLVRAYFLSGYRRIGEERYIDAIIDLLYAEELASSLDDVHFVGLIQRNIAEAFEKMGDQASALAYYKKSAETFKADPDSGYYYWGLYNIARAYNNSLKYEQAVKLTDSLAQLQDVQTNDIIYPHVIALQALANLNNNNNEKALELYRYLQDTGYPFSARDYNNLGTVYLNLGVIDKANECNDSLRHREATDTSLEFAIACKTHNTDGIFKLIDDNFDYTNSEFESIYKRDYAKVIDEYYKAAIDKRHAELQRNKRQFIGFIILAIVLAIIIAVVVYVLMKRKEARVAETLVLVDELSGMLRSQADDISKLQDELAEGSTYKAKAQNQLLSKIEAFNEVCDVYSDSTGDSKQLARRIETFINKNATNKNLEEIEENINEYYDGIILRFRSDFPELTSADVALFTLIVAGFKSPAIALYLKTAISTIYSRKYKLKQKMLKIDAILASEYVSLL